MRRALLLLSLSAVSCGTVSFDVDQDLDMQTVAGSPLGGVLGTFVANPFKLNINISAEVARRGTGPATGAQLKALSLSITPHTAPNGNFDFLSEVHLFVEGAGLPKVEIASSAPVPKGATTLDFTIVPNVNLLPYINAGATISATAMGTQPAHDTSFDGHVTVTVKI
jgi:hypothetical protein